MKYIQFYVLSLVLPIAFLSCSEIPPVINPIMDQGSCVVASESAVDGQERQVLIEEFTGVRCVNCPAGSEAIENLLNTYGDRLIAVSIHAGFFSPPYTESLYDFRTDAGTSVLSFVGQPLGFPTAVVNRKLFSGEDDLQLGQSAWPGAIQSELTEAPKVKLAVRTDFDESSRELVVEVSVFVEADLSAEEVRLSVMLTEDNVPDYQLTPGGKIADYNHRHVLRDMLTSFEGNSLLEDFTNGSRFCTRYVYTMPEAWDENQSHIVAFVSLAGNSKEVLQAIEVGVK